MELGGAASREQEAVSSLEVERLVYVIGVSPQTVSPNRSRILSYHLLYSSYFILSDLNDTGDALYHLTAFQKFPSFSSPAQRAPIFVSKLPLTSAAKLPRRPHENCNNDHDLYPRCRFYFSLPPSQPHQAPSYEPSSHAAKASRKVCGYKCGN